MNGVRTRHVQLFHAVNRASDDVHHTSLDLVSGRHCDWMSCRYDFKTALQAFRVVHGYTPNSVFTDVLLYLYNEVFAIGTLHK